MPDFRDAFTLSRIYLQTTIPNWILLDDVWNADRRFSDGVLAPPNTGYFGGGFGTSTVSTMDKVTYNRSSSWRSIKHLS
jgi:hypothetical protein